MGLRIYGEALAMCAEMKVVLVGVARHDRDLARQIRRAACSVVLNIAEGEHSSDGHRRERIRTARGSAAEVRAGVDAAVAFGLIAPLGEVCERGSIARRARAREAKRAEHAEHVALVGTLSKLAS